jgi:hypothetical protein
MVKSLPDEDFRPEFQNPPLGIPSAAPIGGPAAPVHTVAEMHFHRLRYFIELLAAGYRQALRPDPMPRSLRGERIALGIDLPELDTVPLWSMRRDDGSVAIPCIEFILDEARRNLEMFSREDEPEPGQDEQDIVADCRAALKRALLAARAGGTAGPSGVPHLEDAFMPGSLLDELCSIGGLLEKAVRRCEATLATETSGVRH